MFTSILTAVLSFLGGPVVNGAVKAYNSKLQAGNTSEKIASDLATRELLVQQAEVEAQAKLKAAEVGYWYEPEHMFAYVTLAFYTKCLVWDKMLAWGSTDPLRGDVSIWAGMIMAFYFGKRGFENVARIIARK